MRLSLERGWRGLHGEEPGGRMKGDLMADVYDYVVIGSGFGGSVSAMRLAEKGYRVLVLEKGKRYRDEDFADTNWKFWKACCAHRNSR